MNNRNIDHPDRPMHPDLKALFEIVRTPAGKYEDNNQKLTTAKALIDNIVYVMRSIESLNNKTHEPPLLEHKVVGLDCIDPIDPAIAKSVQPNPLIDQLDNDGRTAITCAAKNQHWDLIPLFIQAGANPNLASKHAGATPLIWSSYHGSLETVKFLLTMPGIQINKQDEKSRVTAIQMAANMKHFDVARILVEAGAHLELFNCEDRTSLDYLTDHSSNPEFSIALLLLDNNAHIRDFLSFFAQLRALDQCDPVVLSCFAKLVEQVNNLQEIKIENPDCAIQNVLDKAAVITTYYHKLTTLATHFRKQAVEEIANTRGIKNKFPLPIVKLISAYDSPLECRAAFFKATDIDTLLDSVEDQKPENGRSTVNPGS